MLSTSCTTSTTEPVTTPLITGSETITTALITGSETSTILTTSTFVQAQVTPDAHSVAALQKCYTDACVPTFNQISTCYAQSSPWTNPYNTAQSHNFRACVCETNATHPFTTQGYFYANFATCAHCIFLAYTWNVSYLTGEVLRVENFCLAQEPDAYLFVKDLAAFFYKLDYNRAINAPNTAITAPPLSAVTPLVAQLSALYTTTPPLANLAYGPSAPEGGSLAGVTPSLTTWTSGTETVTELVTWVPTEGGSTYDAGQASRSANVAASEALSASFAAASGGDGAESTMCYGRGPCTSGGWRVKPLGFAGVALRLSVSMAVMVMMI